MRLQPQIQSVQEAMKHFKDMAYGRLPPRPRRKTRLYGGWGGVGPTTMKTTLVTPTAMAVEQAKAQLKKEGDPVPRRRRRTVAKKTSSKKPGKKSPGTKKVGSKKKSPSTKKTGSRKKSPGTASKKRSAGAVTGRKNIKGSGERKTTHSKPRRARARTYQDNFS